MFKRTFLTTSLAVTTFAFAAGPVAAADGAALYQSKGCTACHGTTGNEPIAPMYPKLKGQNEQYLLNQMKEIKSGARSNGQSGIMKPIVAGVGDDDLAAIAKWLAR